MRTARSDIRGVALVMVMGLILVLAIFGAIVRILSHAAYREVDLISGHLRAIAVGEIGFATVTARLTAAPWSQRWFASGPDLATDVAAGGGFYSYMIRDAPQDSSAPAEATWFAPPHQADLLIRSTFERSSVVMFWRLIIPEDTLDSVGRAIPQCFAMPADTTPVTKPSLDLISRQVNQAVEARVQNTREFEPIDQPLRAASSVRNVGQVLGFQPEGAVSPPAAGVASGPSIPASGPPIAVPTQTPVETSAGTSSTSTMTQSELTGCVNDRLIPTLSEIKARVSEAVSTIPAGHVPSDIAPILATCDSLIQQLQLYFSGCENSLAAPSLVQTTVVNTAYQRIDEWRSAVSRYGYSIPDFPHCGS